MKEDDFPVGDLSKEIARAKGMAKPRGPFMVACHACGKYYLLQHKAEHQTHCKAASVHISAKKGLPYDSKTKTQRAAPIQPQHDQATRDQIPPKQACPYCGTIKVNVEGHIAAKHPVHALGRFSTSSGKSQTATGGTTRPIPEGQKKSLAESDSGREPRSETGNDRKCRGCGGIAVTGDDYCYTCGTA